MRNTAVGNWEVIQSYPPVCSWCWISEAHAYLSQFESSKKVKLFCICICMKEHILLKSPPSPRCVLSHYMW